MALLKRRPRGGEPRPLITLTDPDGGAAEDYRSLRTSLIYSIAGDRPRAIAVSSPGPGEGKSTTAANLAVSLAQAGKSTLVVDADLRRPQIHAAFSARNLRGLVNVLVGEMTFAEAVQEGPLVDLSLLTSGPLPPNPAELLSSAGFSGVLDEARRSYEYVILDTPSVGAVADASVIAAQSDGVLLVIDTQRTRKSSVRHAAHELESVGARLLGTVMNNVRAGRRGYYGYRGYYYSGGYY